jgi:cation transport ATPase
MMKTIILSFLMLFCAPIFAQKPALITIQTNALCADCKDRIETALNQTKGVVYAELNMETKVVEIKYNVKKTDVAKLQKVVTSIGYDADDQKADLTAQRALPLCCQPGGH